MFKKALMVILAGLILGGCSLSSKRSGVEITSYPAADVYIDGKEMGTTPYKNLELEPGETEIKLVTDSRQLIKTLDLQNNINTVIDWQFGENEDMDSGYILYLEKTGDEKASAIVSTNPDKATIKIDGEIKGMSPITIQEIEEGDRQLTVSFVEHKSVSVYMKAISGYRLVIETKLAQEESNMDELIAEQEDSTESSLSVDQLGMVTIEETETGWLKVREASSSASGELTRVNPGESYSLIEEGEGWYKIDLGDETTGWISADYAKKDE